MTAAALQTALALEGPPDPELVRIRDLVYQVAGIFHPDNKLGLLLDRCQRRMNNVKAATLREYFECLTIRPIRQPEMTALLNEITIGETCFFRNPAQLSALARIVLPKIIATKQHLPVHRLRIWSAGCSTGEEPYTLSIVISEQSSAFQDWTLELIATDLNELSLDHARKGVYGANSTRKLDTCTIKKYFVPLGSELQIRPSVRTNINFSRLNLSQDAPMTAMRGFDVIFCCNVLIYFDLASKQRVIQHFRNALLPHGYLFLGQSESLYRVSDDFRLAHFPGATAYVKRDHLEQEKSLHE